METFVTHLETWLILLVVSLLTVFSDKLLGRIRFALNRADLRSKYYEELALDLCTFVFFADLFHVRYLRGEQDGGDMEAVRGEVNSAYVNLKTKEFVYRSWVRRYWNDAGVARFETVMRAATATYEAIIEFNSPDKRDTKTNLLGNLLVALRTNTEGWLSELDA